MADETRRLAIALDDETSASATSAADSLERMAGSLDRMGAAAADASGKPALVSESLRQLSVQAHKLASTKPPAFVSEGARLRALAQDALAAARGLEELKRAQEQVRQTFDRAFADAMRAQREQRRRSDFERDQRVHAAYMKDEAAAMARVPTVLRPTGAAPQISGFGSLVQGAGRLFGPKGAEVLTNAGQLLGAAADKIEKFAPLLKAGGGAILGGAVAIGAVAAAIGAVIAKLGEAMVKMAIVETQFKQGAVGALDALTKGIGGAAMFSLSLKLAKDLNIDREEAVARVKSLLQLGFKGDQIPIVVETLADYRIVKGDEKANALREKLEKLAAAPGGKATVESITGLAEAGVASDAVLERLRKTGESLEQTMARVKAGQVEAAAAIKAITEEVESRVGGVARKGGQSIAGLANSIKISFLDLFADIDTSPLKELLENVKELLESDAGKELKAGITDAGNAVFALLKPFEGEAGKEKLAKLFEQGAQAAHDFADAMRGLAPLLELVSNVAASGGLSVMLDTVIAIIPGLRNMVDILKLINAIANGQAGSTPGAPSIDTSSAAAAALTGGTDAGTNFSSGFASAIKAGASSAVNAAVDMVKAAIGGAQTAQDSHSPSRVTGKLGAYFAQGYTGSISAANDNAARAGEKFVKAATGGAASAVAGAPVPAGTGGGISITYAPVTHLPPGSPEETKQAAEEGVKAGYPAFREHMSRYLRDLYREAS
jgi:hypothetical protein